MAMIFCRGCGKEIHESAQVCPHRGAVQRSLEINSSGQIESEHLWMSITSMVFGIFVLTMLTGEDNWGKDTLTGGVLFSTISLIFGCIAIMKKFAGRGMAIAGVVTAILSIIVCIGMS